MRDKVRVGIIGCGTISGIYLKVAPTFELLAVAACADILVERARARAAEVGVPKAGSARATFPEREIRGEPGRGQRIPVDRPTHIAGVVDFASGAIGTIVTSFDVWAHSLPRIEIYGSEGTLSVPDPNTFGGPVLLRRPGDADWTELPLTHARAENSRSLGVADMAYALRSGRPHRASGELAYHVLDVMQSFADASAAGRHLDLESGCPRPAPLPPGLPEAVLDP